MLCTHTAAVWTSKTSSSLHQSVTYKQKQKDNSIRSAQSCNSKHSSFLFDYSDSRSNVATDPSGASRKGMAWGLASCRSYTGSHRKLLAIRRLSSGGRPLTTNVASTKYHPGRDDPRLRGLIAIGQ
ncbi:hypothetical protein BgiBS90_015631 [Biomphalaria glabrata]|nr:hypothetical protein BgiBS90_015631 [Biomphalaria glabrata]